MFSTWPLVNKEKSTKNVHPGITNTAPIENKFEDKIVHKINRQVIDATRKEKRNVVPGEKTWAEATKTGPAETMIERETNRNTKPMGKVTSNQVRPNRNFQQSQRHGPAGSFQLPKTKRPVISLVGDSIIKGIRKNENNHHMKHASTFVKTFPGATTDDMESYMVPTLKKEPDALIIHCGTNDLRKDDPETIARKITEIGLKSKRTVAHIAVSSILALGNSDLMEGKRLQVNSLLAKSLEENEIHFFDIKTLIKNGDIYYSKMVSISTTKVQMF